MTNQQHTYPSWLFGYTVNHTNWTITYAGVPIDGNTLLSIRNTRKKWKTIKELSCKCIELCKQYSKGEGHPQVLERIEAIDNNLKQALLTMCTQNKGENDGACSRKSS